MIDPTCYVYVIGESHEGPLKIGISSNPTARLAGLQSGYHSRLAILFCTDFEDRLVAREMEAWLHRDLSESRMQGEWFGVTFAQFWEVWSKGPTS